MMPFFNWRRKKENILDKSLLTNNPYVGNGKNIPDINKRNFIKKGILGVMFGVGIAAFSKVSRAGGIIFNDASFQTSAATKLEGSNTTEATTTSTSEVDLLTVSSLSIAVAAQVLMRVALRKTTGATSDPMFRVKLNTTSVSSTNRSWAESANEADETLLSCYFVYGVASYLRAGYWNARGYNNPNLRHDGFNADMPTATLTDVIARVRVENTAVTYGADEMHVWTLAV